MFKKSYFLEGLFARDLVEKQEALKAMVQTSAWGCARIFKQTASFQTRWQGLTQDQSTKAPPVAADYVRRNRPHIRVVTNNSVENYISDLENFAFLRVTSYS